MVFLKKKPFSCLIFRYFQVVTTIFHGKQKHLRNTVLRLFPTNSDQRRFAKRVLETSELAHDRTAISLDMGEIERICYVYKDICDEHDFVNR